ncbi:hypothetical protein KYK43_003296 [Escherichia coli]|uniref:hypothetical protein n=1 Tax=Escherichia coli TaxID=562 RepID=UPI000BB67420|nr:hypothetical protein [Escherichia coli]EFB5172144.1 hypothetical protein [Escherichia coli]EGO8034381.1 hypothetical protein [Escherichia coli]EGO8687226.1 hypothetical protein [Escherichia coli]EGP6255592.1 hypothetical protein [Escherichia coli]EHT8279690.1 hypothetical protein [Escherichia coli]
MSSGKNSAVAKTSTQDRCIEKYKVTDQFKRMMTKATKAQMKVLEMRAEMLKPENWGAEEQQEFFEIFGVTHNTVITIDSREEKIKQRAKAEAAAKKNEEEGNNEPVAFPDPYIETRDNITAYQFMVESVDRLIELCQKLHVKDPVKADDREHGNFVNKTDDAIATANVTADQTLYLKPTLFESILRVNIYQRFVCKELTGPESQVSSLCHELSHFYRTGENGKYGGMGTDDMPIEGGFSRDKNYLGEANRLKSEGDQYVFKNAYNIEKYFECHLSDEQMIEIEKEVQ